MILLEVIEKEIFCRFIIDEKSLYHIVGDRLIMHEHGRECPPVPSIAGPTTTTLGAIVVLSLVHAQCMRRRVSACSWGHSALAHVKEKFVAVASTSEHCASFTAMLS